MTPGKVSLSRVYFVADRRMTARLKKEPCYRIPFELYFPETGLRRPLRRGDEEEADE